MLGLLVPLGVAAAFEQVKLKGDLGALIIGMLLASSPKAGELSKLLFSFKELFLVMFFVSIGLRGDPTWGIVAISALAMVALPLKTIGFIWFQPVPRSQPTITFRHAVVIKLFRVWLNRRCPCREAPELFRLNGC